MHKHLNSPPRNLFTQDKDTKINHFLQAVPFLSFSDKGLENVAKRFGVTLEYLQARIAEFEKGGRRNG